jgi:hypothetical protein
MRALLARVGRRRSVSLLLAAAILAAVSGEALWKHGAPPRGPSLVFPGDGGSFSGAIPSTTNPAPWAMGSVPLCLSRPGFVQITELVPEGGNGELQVVGFATRPRRASSSSGASQMFGASQRTLVDEGFPAVNPVVSVTCTKSGSPIRPGQALMTELAAQFRRTGPGPGWSRG